MAEIKLSTLFILQLLRLTGDEKSKIFLSKLYFFYHNRKKEKKRNSYFLKIIRNEINFYKKEKRHSLSVEFFRRYKVDWLTARKYGKQANSYQLIREALILGNRGP